MTSGKTSSSALAMRSTTRLRGCRNGTLFFGAYGNARRAFSRSCSAGTYRSSTTSALRVRTDSVSVLLCDSCSSGTRGTGSGSVTGG